jgi:hypothetical protein
MWSLTAPSSRCDGRQENCRTKPSARRNPQRERSAMGEKPESTKRTVSLSKPKSDSGPHLRAPQDRSARPRRTANRYGEAGCGENLRQRWGGTGTHRKRTERAGGPTPRHRGEFAALNSKPRWHHQILQELSAKHETMTHPSRGAAEHGRSATTPRTCRRSSFWRTERSHGL